jgi:hypothetical protein
MKNFLRYNVKMTENWMSEEKEWMNEAGYVTGTKKKTAP